MTNREVYENGKMIEKFPYDTTVVADKSSSSFPVGIFIATFLYQDKKYEIYVTEDDILARHDYDENSQVDESTDYPSQNACLIQ